MQVSDHSLKKDIGHLTEETIYKHIRHKMRNCSVTIVLIGARTGHRKWIDWELWASLRAYHNAQEPLKSFKPNGLLVVYLPTQKHSLPSRLMDNIESGYAVTMQWKDVQTDFEKMVELAYLNRDKLASSINNSRNRQVTDYIDFLGMKIGINKIPFVSKKMH